MDKIQKYIELPGTNQDAQLHKLQQRQRLTMSATFLFRFVFVSSRFSTTFHVSGTKQQQSKQQCLLVFLLSSRKRIRNSSDKEAEYPKPTDYV